MKTWILSLVVALAFFMPGKPVLAQDMAQPGSPYFGWEVCTGCPALDGGYQPINSSVSYTVTPQYPNAYTNEAVIGAYACAGDVTGTLTMNVGSTPGGSDIGTIDMTTEAVCAVDPAVDHQVGYGQGVLNPYSPYYVSFSGTATKKIEVWSTDPLNAFIYYSWQPYGTPNAEQLVDPQATQLVLDGAESIKTTLFEVAKIVWPYALAVGLFFLGIRFGMKFFRER